MAPSSILSVAAASWSFHYAKRLLETVFVHRFSHATMPIMNIFRVSCSYMNMSLTQYRIRFENFIFKIMSVILISRTCPYNLKLIN